MDSPKTVSLILEVTTGCQYSCAGCTRDKDSTAMPDEETFDRLIGMYADFKDNGHEFAEIEIGPNDIVTCHNRDEIFANQKLADLANQFVRVAFPINFVQPDAQKYIDLGHQINDFVDTPCVDYGIAFEITQIFNQKYIDTIQRNIDALQSVMKLKNGEIVVNVIFDERLLDKGPLKGKTLEDIFRAMNSLSFKGNTKVDFGLQDGRNGFKDPIAAHNFGTLVRRLNGYYSNDFYGREDEALLRHLPFQLTLNIRGDELVYHRGDLYIRPVINERLTVINEQMRYTAPWTANDYYLYMLDKSERNMKLAESFTDCQNCLNMPLCTSRSVQEVMQQVRTKDCISLLQSYSHIAPELKLTEKNTIRYKRTDGYGY